MTANGGSILDRHNREDRDTKRDLECPMLYAEDIARMAGVSIRWARELMSRSEWCIDIKTNAGAGGRPRRAIPIEKFIQLKKELDDEKAILGFSEYGP